MNIFIADIKDLPHHWPRCVDHISRACDSTNGEMTIATNRDSVMKGDSWLIVVEDEYNNVLAAMTSHLMVCDTGLRILVIPSVGGDHMDEWADEFIDFVKQMRDMLLCDRIRGGGRKGWLRYLKQYGFREEYTVVDME